MVQYLMNQLYELFKENKQDLKIYYYGCDKHKKFRYGTNLGILTKENLNKLYRSVDFGLVNSNTNISLVPLEMIASGLPVIEYEEGSFRYFFPDNCAILHNFDAKQLFEQLLYLMDHPDKLESMQVNGLKVINKLSWKKSSGQFVEILKGIDLKRKKCVYE